ncbi:MAG: signal peptide protein [Verrucomicrobiales bacterium]|nr:signal peptide protein [Verrucomicrobiales bacterium]
MVEAAIAEIYIDTCCLPQKFYSLPMKSGFLAALAVLFLSFSSFAEAKKPYVVFVTGDHEYGSENTMPLLAKALEEKFGMKTTVLLASPTEQSETNIPGLDALKKADLAVFFLRWRQLPDDQLVQIRKYLDSGKPVVGFRTSSHSFNFPKGHPNEKWNAFAEEAFGAPPGWGVAGHTHYGHESSTDVFVNPLASDNPILKGVDQEFHVRSWLYHVVPKYPPADATRLLIGRAVNPNHPAVPNPVAWTYHTKAGGKSFFTTLGHPEDFQVESFQRLVVNSIHWALSKPVPENWPGKLEINVKYGEHPKK